MTIRRDLYSSVNASVGLAAASYSTDQNGSTIDLRGANGCTFLISVGVGGITFSGTNKVEFILQESDDNSTWTEVTTAKQLKAPEAANSSGIVKSLIVEHAAGAVYKVAYLGYKRYVRIKSEFSGTHGTATPLGIVAVTHDLEFEA